MRNIHYEPVKNMICIVQAPLPDQTDGRLWHVERRDAVQVEIAKEQHSSCLSPLNQADCLPQDFPPPLSTIPSSVSSIVSRVGASFSSYSLTIIITIPFCEPSNIFSVFFSTYFVVVIPTHYLQRRHLSLYRWQPTASA